MQTNMKVAIVAAVQSFPAMSGTATEVLRLLQDDTTNAHEVEEIVRYDPGLTANILKIANSAYFCGPGKAASISQAVMQLGWKRMSQVVIASAICSTMTTPVRGYDLPPGELWRQAVASTVAADVLAWAHDLEKPDELFTAALLHDIGKLVMGEYVASFYEEIDMAAARGIPFQEAEREVLGTDHAEVGAMILQNWNLPARIVEAVRFHHEPDATPAPNILTDLVHLGDMACLLIGIGLGNDGVQYKPSLGATARIGLKGAQLSNIADQIVKGLEELSLSLSLQPGAA